MTELITRLFAQACSGGQRGGAGGAVSSSLSALPQTEGCGWEGCGQDAALPPAAVEACSVCAGSVLLGTKATVCEQEWSECRGDIWLGMGNAAPREGASQQHISLGRGRNAKLRGDVVFGNNRSPSPKAGECRLKSAGRELRVGSSEVPRPPGSRQG